MLTTYQPHGLLELQLLKVYERLVLSGDVQHYGPSLSLLSGFYASLQEPCVVEYAVKDDQIWYLAWLDPSAVGINYSVWIAPEVRGTKHALAAVLESLTQAFQLGRVVVVHTRRPSLEREYRRLGFTKCGTLPALQPDETTYLWSLTVDEFAATKARFARVLHVKQSVAA